MWRVRWVVKLFGNLRFGEVLFLCSCFASVVIFKRQASSRRVLALDLHNSERNGFPRAKVIRKDVVDGLMYFSYSRDPKVAADEALSYEFRFD
jgi:hypothetical protein